MIGLVLERYRFTRFQYCSVPYPSVLATDPRFFAPAPCGSGGEKTVHEDDLQICDWRHEPPESARNRDVSSGRHCCESSRIATCARRHRDLVEAVNTPAPPENRVRPRPRSAHYSTKVKISRYPDSTSTVIF